MSTITSYRLSGLLIRESFTSFHLKTLIGIIDCTIAIGPVFYNGSQFI